MCHRKQKHIQLYDTLQASLISVADMYVLYLAFSVKWWAAKQSFTYMTGYHHRPLLQQDTFSLACEKPTAIQSPNRCVRNVGSVMRSSRLACTLRIVSLRNKPLWGGIGSELTVWQPHVQHTLCILSGMTQELDYLHTLKYTNIYNIIDYTHMHAEYVLWTHNIHHVRKHAHVAD